MFSNKLKISAIAFAAAAFSLAPGTGFAQRTAMHGGGAGGHMMSTPAPAPAARSFSNGGTVNRSFPSTPAFSGEQRWHHDRDRDRGTVFFGIGGGWPWWDSYYPTTYAPTSCWNSDYGFYGYWYNGYCYQYPPPY